jgi:hypothetical protein
MPGLAAIASGKVVGMLTAGTGINTSLAAMTDAESRGLAPVAESQVTAQNMAIELAERASEMRYPAVNVYCERMVNKLREKFRAFSGTMQMAIEVRFSQDRLEGIERKVQQYAEALTQVLERNRGDWGEGMFYTGGYEVTFGAVKRGGKNFVQVAKVAFEVEVSRS